MILLSACCSAVAGAAVTARTFAAVRADTLAIVNEFAASVATRQFTFFFYHSIRLCRNLLSRASELSFRKRTTQLYSALPAFIKRREALFQAESCV
jgi:hypothetical protein